MNQDFTRYLQAQGIDSHSWLPYYFIGGKRSIIHTLRLLQGLTSAITLNQGRLSMRQGFFGPAWDTISKRLLQAIPLDMDELLMGEIMPVLINMCYEGIPARIELQMQQEFLSLFTHIKLFIKYPHQSESFNKYILQMKWARETKMPLMPRRPPSFEENLKSALILEHLLMIPMHAANIYTVPRGQMQRALWNPVCGGCILAFTAYFGNVEVGSSLIDSIAQFRAWVHVYNALIQTGGINQGEIPLLDFLFEKFERCKAIWEGPIPVRGKFVTRWWICFGMSLDGAQKYLISDPKTSQPRNNLLRTQTPIEPKLILTSYKRIILRDFSDDKDSSVFDKGTEDWDRLYQTMDAIEEDEQLLAFNWTSIGHFLNDAYVKLMDHCGWMSELGTIIENTSDEVRMGRRMDLRVVKNANSWLASDENMKYQAFAHILARFLFAPLDKNGTDIMAVKVCSFMKEYFSCVPLSKIQWFDLSDYSRI